MALGQNRKANARKVRGATTNQIFSIEKPKSGCISEVVAPTKMHRIRVQALREKGIASNKPSPLMNAAVIVHRDLLLGVRKMKVNWG
jgi:hypothetical protein